MAPAMKTEEENEYEAQRAANIAKNQALLKELQLNAAKAGLGISAPKATNKSTATTATTTRSSSSATADKKKKGVVKKKEKTGEVIIPRRTSSRLAGLQADSEVAKRKAEEEHAAILEAARIKRQRVSGDLDLSSIVVTGKEWDKSRNFLVDVSRAGRKYERTFTEKDIRETGDKGLKELRQRMSGLRLYEGFEPNSMYMILNGVHLDHGEGEGGRLCWCL